MIVRPGDLVVHLITQPDHAALAQRIMEHCVPLSRSPRRASILLAIGEHDNGWRELDERPDIDADGRVVDFINASAGAKQAVWPRAVARLGADPLAAALVAQHAVTVYDRFRADAEWTSFFSEMEAMRDAVLPAAGVSHDELVRDYVYVRLGDLISLTFCTGWTDEHTYGEWRVRRDKSGRIIVSPDAFDLPEIPIDVTALELPDRPFPSDAEFREALANGKQVTLSGFVR
jgi:hypothetical protein